MKNKLILASAILALGAASSFANPNLLNSSWDSVGPNGNEQTITDTPGAEYVFTFTTDGYGVYTPSVSVWWEYDTPEQFMAFGVGGVPDGYRTWSVDLFGITGSDELSFQTEGNGPITPSGAYYSDFSLVEVGGAGVPDLASTSQLLGVGLLGLAALRRKLS